MDRPDLPPSPLPAEDHGVVRYSARIGIVFFLIYFVIYATFVGLCTFKLDWMSTVSVGGINYAVWYGFSLIIIAFVMAALYLQLCKR